VLPDGKMERRDGAAVGGVREDRGAPPEGECGEREGEEAPQFAHRPSKPGTSSGSDINIDESGSCAQLRQWHREKLRRAGPRPRLSHKKILKKSQAVMIHFTRKSRPRICELRPSAQTPATVQRLEEQVNHSPTTDLPMRAATV
jgi:hypothetical protein